MNRRRGVERIDHTGSKTVINGALREAYRKPVYWVSGPRHIGGVTWYQAGMWNVGTCRSDAKGKPQAANPMRGKVPMRSTGADRSVVVRKLL